MKNRILQVVLSILVLGSLAGCTEYDTQTTNAGQIWNFDKVCLEGTEYFIRAHRFAPVIHDQEFVSCNK